MKVIKILGLVAVLVGTLVAIVSVYKVSVSGLMNKVGLVGADFGAAVSTEKLSGVVAETKSTLSCNLLARMRGTLEFVLGGDRQQAELAFQLGESRIKCGAVLMYGEKAEEGTYEVIKGMGYMTKGYNFVTERAELDRAVCKSLPGNALDQTVGEILESTNGKVYEIIWNEWQNVINLRETTERVCIDQRMK